jgi:hypothetical protein
MVICYLRFFYLDGGRGPFVARRPRRLAVRYDAPNIFAS